MQYSVQPSPHKPIPAEAEAAYKATPVNLQAQFSGGDPFVAPEQKDSDHDEEGARKDKVGDHDGNPIRVNGVSRSIPLLHDPRGPHRR